MTPEKPFEGENFEDTDISFESAEPSVLLKGTLENLAGLQKTYLLGNFKSDTERLAFLKHWDELSKNAIKLVQDKDDLQRIEVFAPSKMEIEMVTDRVVQFKQISDKAA